jgi:Na+/H+ antiporter NhaC
MRRAESAALSGADPNIRRRDAEDSDTLATSGWLAAIPILVLVGVTVAVMYQTGAAKVDPVVGADGDYLATLRDILKEADTYSGILYGAIASLTVALLLTFISRACSIRDAMDGALDGMSRMFPAIVVLVLAWSLSSVSQDLKMGQVATRYLTEWNLPAEWLPLVVFAIAAIVSFATGSSWTTMGILTPVVVEVAARLAGAGPEADAINLFYAAVGSVLAGSIFGDHCSPISDTTVLSSVATGCRVEDHVWTQMPYALVVAIVGMGAGNYYCMHYDQPPWVGLAIGAGALLFIVLLIGRNPRPSDMLQPPSRDRLETRLRAQTQQASESAARPPAPQPPRGGSGLV